MADHSVCKTDILESPMLTPQLRNRRSTPYAHRLGNAARSTAEAGQHCCLAVSGRKSLS